MLWRCGRCGTRYAVGLPFCPQCTSTDAREDDEDMAKITVAGGPSDASLPPEPQVAGEASSPPAAASPAVAPPAEEPATEAEASEWEGYTVAELRSELTNRGLPISGTKAELVARLEADAADADAAEDQGG